MTRLGYLFAFLCLHACASPPGQRLARPLPPLAEPLEGSQAALLLGGLPGWSLIGNDLTPGQPSLPLLVLAPAGAQRVEVWLGPNSHAMQRKGEHYALSLDMGELLPGEHELLFVADAEERAFARHRFVRSHPLYILTSTDWDTADSPDASLALHEELHRKHPELLITHLLGPYTFLDLDLDEARVQHLVDWCAGMRDTHGDEIGVHIHPYRNLVEAVGAGFHDAPTGGGPPDPTGYSVNLSTYAEDELCHMLQLAVDLFEERGLGRPISFRAGAWNADAGVMRALDRTGFRVDSSALNTSRIEEWSGRPLFTYVSQLWPEIDATSQPYYMNQDDPSSRREPRLGVLQVPDNGALVDYVSAEEMIEIFRANWPGGALDEPLAVSIGWHPINFNRAYAERIDAALVEFDRHLASGGDGPVVYARMGDMPHVWKP